MFRREDTKKKKKTNKKNPKKLFLDHTLSKKDIKKTLNPIFLGQSPATTNNSYNNQEIELSKLSTIHPNELTIHSSAPNLFLLPLTTLPLVLFYRLAIHKRKHKTSQPPSLTLPIKNSPHLLHRLPY